MNTATLTTKTQPNEPAVSLSGMAAGDQLLLWTQNSFYKFLVTDAVTPRGQLWRGGAQVAATAVTLLGTAEQANGGANAAADLRIGQRAVFLVADGGERRRLYTSTITGLNLVKAEEPGANSFTSETWDDAAGLIALPCQRQQSHDTVDSLFIVAG